MKKKSRVRIKIHNFILKTIAWTVGITFLVSACLLDGDSYIPHIVCGSCILWFLLFCIANNWFVEVRNNGE